VIGVPATPNKKNAQLDKDPGRYAITSLQLHKFSFKTPTVRNAALTSPYMHNGAFETLEQVIDFYDKGGCKGFGVSPVNQTLTFDKLNLTKGEKKDLIAFIKSLTDTTVFFQGN